MREIDHLSEGFGPLKKIEPEAPKPRDPNEYRPDPARPNGGTINGRGQLGQIGRPDPAKPS